MWMVFWTFLTPPPPPMWIILLNKGYVLMWIFREPPLPPGHPHGLWMFPSLDTDYMHFTGN